MVHDLVDDHRRRLGRRRPAIDHRHHVARARYEVAALVVAEQQQIVRSVAHGQAHRPVAHARPRHGPGCAIDINGLHGDRRSPAERHEIRAHRDVCRPGNRKWRSHVIQLCHQVTPALAEPRFHRRRRHQGLAIAQCDAIRHQRIVLRVHQGFVFGLHERVIDRILHRAKIRAPKRRMIVHPYDRRVLTTEQRSG